LSLTKQNIETLLVLCKKGNQLAQMEVYNRYHNAMFNTALRIVKDSAEAEDIMQESFLTAFNKLDSFNGEATFGSWIKRIVVNNSITQYRKTQRYIKVSEDAIKESFSEEETGVCEDDYTNTKVSEVLQSLEALHESYREVLTLHLIEGYDYEELCEILNISYANCRTLISRAKESLRKKLSIAI
jgi:RNA polymerase sigma factor (sigma-70 family)